MEQDKQIILDHFIENLPFNGWNKRNIEASVKQAGFEDGYYKILFPAGLQELTQYFVNQVEAKSEAKTSSTDFDGMRISDKISIIIFDRISSYHQLLKSPESVKKFLSYCTQPENVSSSLGNIYNFSSSAWYSLNDKSTDFSFYTKRLSLSAIYSKCFLYSINDESEKLAKTKSFIDKSISNLMNFHKMKNKLASYLTLPNLGILK